MLFRIFVLEMEDLLPVFPDFDSCSLHPGGPFVMAGPCSAESREQTLAAARELAAGGVRVFRAGVWKPRTRPGGFEGIGEPALSWLAEAKALTGMRVLTEVATPGHVRAVVDAGLDGFWIGARTSANPFAVQEIADEVAKLDPARLESLAVFVKNPVSPDLELWIGALQRIYGAGVRRLAAIHRGFSFYAPAPSPYRNAPYWQIPIELKRRFPALPVIFDPSHTGGRRDLIASLSRQALDMGLDGLIVEVHCNPGDALSDSAQQLTPSAFFNVAEPLRRPAEASAEATLSLLRDEIDAVDSELLDLLSRRMDIARRIGEFKRAKGLAVVQPTRYARLIDERSASAEALGLSRDFAKRIFSAVHEESVRQQMPPEDFS